MFKVGDKVEVNNRYRKSNPNGSIGKIVGKGKSTRDKDYYYDVIVKSGKSPEFPWFYYQKDLKPVSKRGHPAKPKKVKFVVIYDEEDGDPTEKFYSRKELMKWLKEAQDDEEIIWDSIEIYLVDKKMKPTANVKISLRKV